MEIEIWVNLSREYLISSKGDFHWTTSLQFSSAFDSVVREHSPLVLLVSSLTRQELTKKEQMLLFVCSEAIESKLVKLETGHRYTDTSPQWWVFSCSGLQHKYSLSNSIFPLLSILCLYAPNTSSDEMRTLHRLLVNKRHGLGLLCPTYLPYVKWTLVKDPLWDR